MVSNCCCMLGICFCTPCKKLPLNIFWFLCSDVQIIIPQKIQNVISTQVGCRSPLQLNPIFYGRRVVFLEFESVRLAQFIIFITSLALLHCSIMKRRSPKKRPVTKISSRFCMISMKKM